MRFLFITFHISLFWPRSFSKSIVDQESSFSRFSGPFASWCQEAPFWVFCATSEGKCPDWQPTWSHLSDKEGGPGEDLSHHLPSKVCTSIRVGNTAKVHSERKELNKHFGKPQGRIKNKAIKQYCYLKKCLAQFILSVYYEQYMQFC